ncbi:Non-essential glycogen phosphorylase, partial [Kappamyces sp. JEL0680]
MDEFAAYQSTAYSVRDQLLEQWNVTQQYLTSVSPKRVYYLSLEFLIGRSMDNALLNLGVKDSLATLDYPAWGYGIRYNYGIFEQRIVDGYQMEHPDYWLTFGNPWEIQRLDVAYDVKFGGRVISTKAPAGKLPKHTWEPSEKVVAIAYDYPIPG